jgi:hypothetical protein
MGGIDIKWGIKKNENKQKQENLYFCVTVQHRKPGIEQNSYQK